MRPLQLLAMLITLATALSACSPPPQPRQRGILQHSTDPAFVHGTDHSQVDRIAATVVTDLQQYWAETFPRAFQQPWRDLDGGFFSVDTTGNGNPPPCATAPADVAGNAFYCATVDAIAWDRSALLPVLAEHHGQAAIALVLAHETGHAVQQRLGVDLGDNNTRLETTADCYAGAYFRWAADGNSAHLRLDDDDIDTALRTLSVFYDHTPSGNNAHGTAFDRTTAFQHGYRNGPAACPAHQPQHITSPTPATHHAPDAQLPDINEFFQQFVTDRGGTWQPPAHNPDSCRPAPAPVAVCLDPPAVRTDQQALDDMRYEIGDHATTAALAAHHALIALHQLHQPVTGRDATRRTSCLTGAYLRWRATTTGLAAADLDEALNAVLTDPTTTRDATGHNPLTGHERTSAFRTGLLTGTPGCDP